MARPPRGNSTPPSFSDSAIRVKWSTSRAYDGPYPTVYKQFYKLETLHNACEKLLREQDRFFWTTLTSLAGGTSPLRSLQCDLLYEDTTRFVYDLALPSSSRKTPLIRLAVAKNHEECSIALEKEYNALIWVGKHIPDHAPTLHAYGHIYLPDRYRRREINREVFAYFYTIPYKLAPLYVASTTQLGPHGEKAFRYSNRDTEALKKRIITLLANCYDMGGSKGVLAEDLYPECFSVRAQTPVQPASLLLRQCPRMRTRLGPKQFMNALLLGYLRSGKTYMALAPINPADFHAALVDAVGAENAKMLCSSLLRRPATLKDTGSAKIPVELPGRAYIEALAEAAGI